MLLFQCNKKAIEGPKERVIPIQAASAKPIQNKKWKFRQSYDLLL